MRSGASGRRGSGRGKLRVLLTECEVERVDCAVAASGACSRGLLIVEAVRAGLANPELKLEDGRRLRRIDALAPRKLIARLRYAAAAHNVTQQHLLRTYLFQYLTAAPWEQAAKEVGRIVSCN